MQKLVLTLIAVLVLAGCVGQTVQKGITTTDEPIKPTGVTKEFTISGITDVSDGTYRFSKDKITVSAGDVVKIIFTTTDVSTGHNLNIDEFDGHIATVNGGATNAIEFFADKKGEFKYYCNIGNHRETGMEGILVVE